MVQPDERHDTTATAQGVAEIVVFPVEADITNSGTLGQDLLSALRPGVSLVIADLSATEFCDTSAIRDLLFASNHATCTGAELRVVVCSPAVRRAMEILGADQMLRLYPDLSSALARVPHTGEPAGGAPSMSPQTSCS